MNTPRNRELAIFSAAMELEASQRLAYLDKACAGDPALREHLEALLGVQEKALNFLESPADGAPISRAGGLEQLCGSPAEKLGDSIGRYKLLQQIGEGGCGVVYMAEQKEPVRRRVALKVIKLGMDTKQVVARFEAERQALALMDHPNIARVLDAGATETGRPYFVMELVRGVKLTDYCDQNNVSTGQRLELFLQVCKAIQHAHQKGVIHRDIKPSNILVTVNDGVPVPKVIDFGIAKATQGRLTDQTLFTAFEQFIGTPAYMSPEQAVMTSLDIDTRSDIYSLGVLLYELLTGATPFDTRELLALGLDKMRRTIRETEPARPSTRLRTMVGDALVRVAQQRQAEPGKLVSLIRGDLDWIVMKCLEKDRARRYETANGLARDLERYLADEPVVARPPSRTYQFQKMVRRNKRIFAAAGAVALMLVLGVVASTWQAMKALRAEQEQARLRLQAEAEKHTAQAEAVKFQKVSSLLQKILRGFGPSKALGREPKLILQDAARSVSLELTNQPEVAVELFLILADTYHDMGYYAEMEGVARQSLELARSKFGEENLSVAFSLTSLGDAVHHLGELSNGRLEEAEEFSRAGLAMSRKLLGNENLPVTRALKHYANVLATEGKLIEAETMQREALGMYRKFLGNEDPEVAKALYDLAQNVASQENRLADAEPMQREVVEMQRKLLGPSHPELAKSLHNLALTLASQGKLTAAETNYVESLAIWRKVQSNDRVEITRTLRQLGSVLMQQDKLDDAEKIMHQELAMLRRLLGDKDAEVGLSAITLADVLKRQGKLADAQKLLREIAEHGNVLAMNSVAWMLATGPDPKLRDGAAAVSFAEKAVAATDRKAHYILDTLAAAYAEASQFTNAVQIQQEALSLLQSDEDTNAYSSRLRLYQSNSPCRE